MTNFHFNTILLFCCLFLSSGFDFALALPNHDIESRATTDSLPPISIVGQIGSLFYKTAATPHDNLSSAELAELQEGDLLLRKGYGWVSDRIADYLEEEYRVTHCALILRAGYEEPQVLHSLSNEKVNGIFIEPLSDYLLESQAGSLVGIRIKGTAEERALVIREAKRLLAKKVPFDMAFNDADTTELYCAELMGYIFHRVYGEDLLPEKSSAFGLKAIRMRNFFNPIYFEILFNHFDSKK
jgi:hypothetical protein